MTDPAKCAGCQNGEELGFDFAMAFQPIVDLSSRRTFAYEALVRGPQGQPAGSVLGQVTEANRYAFDQSCRVKAIEGAVAAGILETDAKLSINFLPNAVYSPKACIQLTLKTAAAMNFPTDRLVFEFTENERMTDPQHVASIVAAYKQMGFGTALDDFGAGYAGLNLLARFQPDLIKLDMDLIRDIDKDRAKTAIVSSIVRLASDLGITVIAEGIESEAELAVLRDLGITLIQGYLLARPEFGVLPQIAEKFLRRANDGSAWRSSDAAAPA